MRTTTLARAFAAAGALVGLTLASVGVASATDPPAGYPGTIEKLDWPKGPIVNRVPPPDSGEKPEGELPTSPTDEGSGGGGGDTPTTPTSKP